MYARQSVEIAEAFHLAFLAVLAALVDPRSFALKGGGNLRFYFNSLRFSEDIDLDTFVREPAVFSLKVQKAFESASLAKLLATLGIGVSRRNPKVRTATKEKWVVELAHRDVGAPIFTRVEISHRAYGLEAHVAVETANSPAVAAYAPLPAPTIGHYLPRGALIQKLTALRDRAATQPRDVFDLDHIVRMYPAAAGPGLVDEAALTAATARIYEIGYPAYRSKVVSFLDPSVRATLDSPDAWGAMQVRVVEALEAMRS